jgi:SulP family sulfate permease
VEAIRQFSREVISGTVTSIISLVYSLSFAALIFSGGLAGGLSQGISALLIGTGITALAVALFSGFRFAVSGPDANACAVMASMAAAIATDLAARTTPAVATINVLYMLALSTLITGIFLTVLGTARAGRWIRFIPYPVVGGLIAAAGALTILGAARVIGGTPVTPSTFFVLADPLLQKQFLVGLAWTCLLFAVLPRFKSAIALPLVQIGGIIAFHCVLAMLGLSATDARVAGWLFDSPATTMPWMPWNTIGIAQTEWSLLFSRAADIGTLVLVTTLTVLINATGLEVETRKDANLDRELTLQGAANIVSPLAGGFLGYLSMNRSMMNFKLGGTGRVSGLVFSLVAIVLAFTGMGLVGYLPRALLGGLLLYFGITLLRKWTLEARAHLPAGEYITLLLILAVTVIFGFGYGLSLGILVGCVMFAVTYSKVRVIKFSFTGKEFRSSYERSTEDKALLARHGEDIRVFVLQGFIFFGMADRLYRSVLELAFPAAGPGARIVVLDLKLVHGVDASAIASFKKISYSTRAAGARLVITGMGAEQVVDWQASGDTDLLEIRYFAELDAGVEWCESEILVSRAEPSARTGEIMRGWLQAEVGNHADTLLGYMQRCAPAAGELLCRQDDPADEVYFIESGRVAIDLAISNGETRRLRTLGPKTVLGEMGLYRSANRSANVVVLEPSVIFRLTAAAMREIEKIHPQAAARFHAMVVRTIADRLEFSNALVAALQR